MTELLSGNLAAQGIIKIQKNRIGELWKQCSIVPKLSALLFENGNPKNYINGINASCYELGIYFEFSRLPTKTKQEELEYMVKGLNKTNNVHGILMQNYLPEHIDRGSIFSLIEPKKDVNAVSLYNKGGAIINTAHFEQPLSKSILVLLDYHKVPLKGLKGAEVVIVGGDNVDGRLLTNMMINEHATVTLCHPKTMDLKYHTQRADILIALGGEPNSITKDNIKKGAIVIDASYKPIVDFKNVKDVGYVALPGSVSRLSEAVLLQNVVNAAYNQLNIPND